MKTKTYQPQKLTTPFFIGSKSRVNLPVSNLLYNAVLFVEPQDLNTYKRAHGRTFTIQCMDSNDMGFGYMANQQLKYAKKKGFDYYVFCDDDVFGFKESGKKTCDINAFFNDGVAIMKKHGLSQLMMSFSGHGWFQKTEVKEKIGAWCVVINKTEDLLAAGGYDEQLPIFNDWDMSARLIKSGKKTAVWNRYCFNHKMNSQKGGAEFLYKKQGRIDHAIDMLEQRFGKEAIRRVKGTTGLQEARFNWNKL